MKRIITVLAAMAIMAAMVAASAMPAFAKGQSPCQGNGSLAGGPDNPPLNQEAYLVDANGNGDGYVCVSSKGVLSDNRFAPSITP